MHHRSQFKKPLSSLYGGLAAGLVAVLIAGTANAQLVHRYSFDEVSGTNVADSVGTADGILINGSGSSAFSGGTLILGNNGSIGSNAGSGIDYVDLPNGIISALAPSASFEAWVTWDGGGAWQRVFDYGNSNGGENNSGGAGNAYYTYICPRSGPGVLLAEAACIDGQADQQLGWNGPMATGTLVHVATVIDEDTLGFTFYLNGRAINFTTLIDFRLNLLNDVNNWLGRSQWPDTMFNGTYHEVRIYDNPLTAGEILESYLAGPDAVGTVDLGDPVSANLIGLSEMILGNTANFGLELDYATQTGVVVYADANLSYSSSDTNVATVTDNGLVTAVALGTTTVQVAYGTITDSIELVVLPVPLPPAVMVHQYSFNSDAAGPFTDAAGTEPDLAGTANGDVWGGQFMGPSDPDNPGTLLLDNVNFSYVDLPNGLISSLTNATIEMWVKPNNLGGNWQRFWDIGTTTIGEIGPEIPVPAADGLDYWMMTARVGADNTARLEMNSLPAYKSYWAQTGGNNGVPRGQEHHLVAVYNASAGKMAMYLNGIRVFEEGGMNMPLSELPDVNVWIGRSNWQNDSFVNAYYNEFRVYEGVLTPLQVAVNAAAGPDTFVGDPGSPTAVHIAIATNELRFREYDANALADFTAVSGVPVDSLGAEWSIDDPGIATIDANGLVMPVTAGSTTIRLSYDGMTDSLPITVIDIGTGATLAHRYSFSDTAGSTTALDSVGGANGTVIGTDGVFDGNQLHTPGGAHNGTNAYVDLPNGMISALGDQATFELWATWEGAGNWGRVFSFGRSVVGEDDSGQGLDWIDLITQAGNTGRLSWDMAYDGAGTGATGGPTAMPQGVELHFVGVIDSVNGINRLFLNGQFVDSADISSTWKISALRDINNWLGRGQWPDQRFNGSFNEFRIYTGLLSAEEAALSYARGPDNLTGAVTVPLGASLSGNTLSLTWPTTTPATVQSTTDLTNSGAWGDVGGTPVETNGVFQQSIPLTQDAEAFRLTD